MILLRPFYTIIVALGTLTLQSREEIELRVIRSICCPHDILRSDKNQTFLLERMTHIVPNSRQEMRLEQDFVKFLESGKNPKLELFNPKCSPRNHLTLCLLQAILRENKANPLTTEEFQQFIIQALNKTTPLKLFCLSQIYKFCSGAYKAWEFKVLSLHQYHSFPPALENLACHYESGFFCDLDHKKAIALREKAVQANYAHSLYKMGIMHLHGKHSLGTIRSGKVLIRRAALLNHTQAQHFLGDEYSNLRSKIYRYNIKKALFWYKKASISSAKSAYRAALLYEKSHSKGAQLKAITFYEKAANSFFPPAIHKLGLIYLLDAGNKNYQKALHYLNIASHFGYKDAHQSLAWMYKTGTGVAIDKNLNLKHLYDASALGCGESSYEIANMFSRSGPFPNESLFLNYLHRSAMADFPAAQYKLAWVFYDGVKAEFNMEEALFWFNKAAHNQYPQAQYKLANMYFYGEELERDYITALKWYKSAAHLGHSKAQYKYGFMLYHGLGSQIQYSKALFWFKKAAYQDNMFAQYYLGEMYLFGIGIKSSYRNSCDWLEKASSNGHYKARFLLGMTQYERGNTRAFGLIQDAAYWGVPKAQYHLAYMFERGIGVSPDIKQAIFWYKKAIENGNLLAVMHLDKLVAKKKGHDKYPHINTIKRAIMRFFWQI